MTQQELSKELSDLVSGYYEKIITCKNPLDLYHLNWDYKNQLVTMSIKAFNETWDTSTQEQEA